MERLSERVGIFDSRWLASSLTCCFPSLPDQREPDPPSEYTPSTCENHLTSPQSLVNTRTSAKNNRDLHQRLSLTSGIFDLSLTPADRANGLPKVEALPREHQDEQAQLQGEARAVDQQ